MRKHTLCTSVLSLAVGAWAASSATASSTYDLPIDHTQSGTFTTVPGGYLGHLAVSHTGSAGDSARVYWLVPNSVGPTDQLFTIQWWGATGSGATNTYQPFESQISGAGGEVYPIDPTIPWAGAFGTNHQYISNNNGPSTDGQFNNTGPGPHTPDSAAVNAGANGTQMWLHGGSEVYVKWDFGFYTNQTNILSDIQITSAPEPASLSVLGLGAVGLLKRRRRILAVI